MYPPESNKINVAAECVRYLQFCSMSISIAVKRASERLHGTCLKLVTCCIFRRECSAGAYLRE